MSQPDDVLLLRECTARTIADINKHADLYFYNRCRDFIEQLSSSQIIYIKRYDNKCVFNAAQQRN